MKPTLTLLAMILGACALPAQAQMVKAQQPETLVRALQEAGYTAKLGADGTGDPMISSGVGGTQFKVFFYNCTEHKACATVQFHAGYSVKTRVTLAQINEWNRTQRFGRAHLDGSDDPILQMDLDLDDGGISTMLFIDNLEFWTAVLANFEKHIGYR